jgi:hypothetical protein
MVVAYGSASLGSISGNIPTFDLELPFLCVMTSMKVAITGGNLFISIYSNK